MGAFAYLGLVEIVLAIAVGVRWFEPTVVDQLARQTGFGGTAG